MAAEPPADPELGELWIDTDAQVSYTGGLPNAFLVALLDPLIVGAITRNADDAATSAGVVWPDGATGLYTATVLSSDHPGAVDAYTVTKVVGSVTTTYTQPTVTRNANGAVTNRPAITES